MKKRREIEKAILDSKRYFKENFPKLNPNQPHLDLNDWERSIKILAVANEICTLKWVLNKKGSKLNCYEKSN